MFGRNTVILEGRVGVFGKGGRSVWEERSVWEIGESVWEVRVLVGVLWCGGGAWEEGEGGRWQLGVEVRAGGLAGAGEEWLALGPAAGEEHLHS